MGGRDGRMVWKLMGHLLWSTQHVTETRTEPASNRVKTESGPAKLTSGLHACVCPRRRRNSFSEEVWSVAEWVSREHTEHGPRREGETRGCGVGKGLGAYLSEVWVSLGGKADIVQLYGRARHMSILKITLNCTLHQALSEF